MLSAQDGPRELRAAVLALRIAPRELRNVTGRELRQTMNPVWRTELARSATGGTEQIILKGARIAGTNPPALVTASGRRRWRPGSTLVPVEHWHAFEYGANRNAYTTYRRTSPRGTVHDVRRRTKAQLPPRNRDGYVIGPTVARIGPRITSLFVQSVVRTVMDAAEGTR